MNKPSAASARKSFERTPLASAKNETMVLSGDL